MLFVTPVVTAILDALGESTGSLAVVGNARLAQALAEKRPVIPVGMTARATKSLKNKPNLSPVAELSSLEPGSLAAAILEDITIDDGWSATLRAWSRVVRDGGAVILVDRGRATEASRRALCSGLSELEQRHAGRVVITSGLVTQLATFSARTASPPPS